jgi:hypothetical protein
MTESRTGPNLDGFLGKAKKWQKEMKKLQIRKGKGLND